MSHLDRFPKLSDAQYHAMLQPPSAPVRCVIDTDTRNEIDDQFALAWALLSQETSPNRSDICRALFLSSAHAQYSSGASNSPTRERSIG